MNAVLDYIAMWLLPFVAVASWRHSHIVSVACSIAFVSSIAYLDTHWDPLRWIVAALTGIMGIVALARVATLAPSVRNVLKTRAAWLSALLVGSSCADLVSLHYEAKGHEWGALPILQIVVCVAMILISIVQRKADQEPPTVRPSALREA